MGTTKPRHLAGASWREVLFRGTERGRCRGAPGQAMAAAPAQMMQASASAAAASSQRLLGHSHAAARSALGAGSVNKGTKGQRTLQRGRKHCPNLGTSSGARHGQARRPLASAAVSVENSSGGSEGASAASKEDIVFVAFPETPLIVPYPETSAAPDVFLTQLSQPASLYNAVADYIVQASRDAIAARGLFVVALSGGSLVEALAPLAEEPYKSQVDWSKWHVLWVDERFVRHTSDDSNFKQAAAKLLAKVPIPEDQILPTDDEIDSLAGMAEDYESLLRELVEDGVLSTTQGQEFPRLDLILLGIGPDGHTASLFPNHSTLTATSRWVLPVAQSPKPPPQRITMTLPVINAARKVAFVACGAGKAEVVQRIFERSALPGSLPAQLVRPYAGDVIWFLDDAAANRLAPQEWDNKKKFPFVEH